MNGDGRADIAIGTPDEISPDGLRGRVTYFLGNSNPASLTETWPVRGVNGVAKLMINSPCCVPFISACCNTGSLNASNWTAASPLLVITGTNNVVRKLK